MYINVFSKKQTKQFLLIFILLIQIININGYKQQLIAADNDDDGDDFLDIGIRLTNGKQDSLLADLIASERDILNAGHINGIDMYHFHIRRKRHHRSKRAIDEIVEDLKRDERIGFVTIGKRLERVKREFIDDFDMIDVYARSQQRNKYQLIEKYKEVDISSLQMTFDDELYRFQWYLENKGQLHIPANHDINVVPAWFAGYSGKGVVICIVDDGLDHRHPDLTDFYRGDLSYDLNDLNDPEHDPSPRMEDSDNRHGTRCGGAAASRANNELCGVGPAHGASLAGIRLLDGPITNLIEARSMILFVNETDIKSSSWGPTDDGTQMEAPGSLISAALDYAVTHGRNGKGTLLVWASGNGGNSGDDCGADGYVSHPNVISIGAINHLGKTTYFHEYCPSTMAVVHAGGKHENSIDEEKLPIGIVTTDPGGTCSTQFFGTSAAAPVAAGALALVLEANPELSYRDVMHIIAQTARIPNLEETDDWIINAAGFHVSDKFGFGVLDAGQMVALAQNWTNVQSRYECYQEWDDYFRELKIGDTIEVSINIQECLHVTSIEHVVANISYSFHRRGDVKITLISPSGTPSELLSYRKNDANHKGIEYFPFSSVHKWGENPIGLWKLRIETCLPQTINSTRFALIYEGKSELSYFGLRIYGSNGPNGRNNRREKKEENNYAFKPSKEEIHTIFERELYSRESTSIMQKRDYDKLLQERQLLKEKRNEIKQDKSIFGYFQEIFHF